MKGDSKCPYVDVDYQGSGAFAKLLKKVSRKDDDLQFEAHTTGTEAKLSEPLPNEYDIVENDHD